MYDKEQQILKLFSDGAPDAVDRLYDGYAGYLAGVCSRYVSGRDDLHDVMQESFIKIITKLSSFSYRGKGSLKAWLTKVAVNESLRFIKARNPLVFDNIDDTLADIPDEEPDIEGISMNDIAAMIAQLPDGYRAVFNLYAIEGKSHKEIGSMLNIKPDTSASQYLRAKRMLAAMIKEYRRKEDRI
jgi:RNA polymerase sigma factor (sigma-70 family)